MGESIVFFDGTCLLCSGTVQFILKHDRRRYFRFASLQGKSGQETLRRLKLPTDHFHSFLLLENGKIYTRSTAALRMLRRLGLPWSMGYAWIIIPPFIRDAFYNLIAKNRYKWFGRRESCWLPRPEWAGRFLD